MKSTHKSLKFLIKHKFISLLFVLTLLPNLAYGGALIFFIDSATGKFYRVNDDGSGLTAVLTQSDGVGSPDNLTVNADAGRLYWRDVSTSPFGIKRVDLGESSPSVETIVTDGGILDIALDFPRSKIYWSSSDTVRSIKRANLNGTNTETIYTTSQGFGGPFGLAVDSVSGYLYFINEGDKSIRRIDLSNGGNETTIVSSSTSTARRLIIDLEGSRLFWTDQFGNKIYKSNLDGSGVTSIATANAPEDLDLDPVNDLIYWTEFVPAKVRRVSTNGGTVEDIVSNNSELITLAGITVFDEGELLGLRATLSKNPIFEVNGDDVELALQRFSSISSAKSSSLFGKGLASPLSALASGKLQLQYQVSMTSTANEIFKKTSKLNTVTYSNLDPGTYTASYKVEILKKRTPTQIKERLDMGFKGNSAKFKVIGRSTTSPSSTIEVD